MTKHELLQLIRKKKSFLCVGLDTDIAKIPDHLKAQDDPVFEFNKAIIDATHAYTIAYKPNLAFYESLGARGWLSLEKTVKYLKQFDVFTIADAKRGDIGNTSSLYARAFFEQLDVDAITVAPYMGIDSVSPFMKYPGKWVIVLALTSNKGASDFQFMKNESSGKMLYEEVLNISKSWGNKENIMYVVGATKAENLGKIRAIVPEHFLLVPGVGAQGGSLEEVAEFGMTKECGLIVNSSRGIIYASRDENFADKATENAVRMQSEMANLLDDAGIL